MLWLSFNKDYVKNQEMGRKIGQAEEIRHASDYDDFYIATNFIQITILAEKIPAYKDEDAPQGLKP